MRSIQNKVSENKAKLKEKLRIQEDRQRRNKIRVDDIEEDENETWENTENKQRSLLYDKLEITDAFYIERAHCVRRAEGENLIVTTILEQLLISFQIIEKRKK